LIAFLTAQTRNFQAFLVPEPLTLHHTLEANEENFRAICHPGCCGLTGIWLSTFLAVLLELRKNFQAMAIGKPLRFPGGVNTLDRDQ
jgi:hypothetical protein